ncbi:hypothetical protein [Nitrososphaera viennensis]|uniref:Uncharacterized protein n=2 Tax=Nitrososphaera viennensis TaxID=1034015 RepID=A0A060HPJ6_9ARCH|nr:hypothetical protein [Nitrososphaera viennensis]AIC17060.1 hypothetical protein NVIE_027830 [Nitrososphaera viennensis EN76]UVS68953.1 hypothetical protein NWT39_13730 [Nitrososphaera viennensis]
MAAIERPAASYSSFVRPSARKKPRVRAHFLICNSCLWCASGLGPAARIDMCPGCGKTPVEALPIMPNEMYSMKKTGNSGVELDFTTTTTTTLA